MKLNIKQNKVYEKNNFLKDIYNTVKNKNQSKFSYRNTIIARLLLLKNEIKQLHFQIKNSLNIDKAKNKYGTVEADLKQLKININNNINNFSDVFMENNIIPIIPNTLKFKIKNYPCLLKQKLANYLRGKYASSVPLRRATKFGRRKGQYNQDEMENQIISAFVLTKFIEEEIEISSNNLRSSFVNSLISRDFLFHEKIYSRKNLPSIFENKYDDNLPKIIIKHRTVSLENNNSDSEISEHLLKRKKEMYRKKNTKNNAKKNKLSILYNNKNNFFALPKKLDINDNNSEEELLLSFLYVSDKENTGKRRQRSVSFTKKSFNKRYSSTIITSKGEMKNVKYINLQHITKLIRYLQFRKKKQRIQNALEGKIEKGEIRGEEEMFQILKMLIINGDIKLFKTLLSELIEYININKQDENGNTLLILCTKQGFKDFVDKLLKIGAKVNIKNNLGNTALHYAVSRGYFGIADSLANYEADDDVTNNDGLTPWECVGKMIDNDY